MPEVPGRRHRAAPHSLIVAVLWPICTLALALILGKGTDGNPALLVAAYALSALYVAALLWYLGRTGPDDRKLPSVPPLLKRWSATASIQAGGMALLFTAALLSSDGLDLLALTMMIATIWILAAWYREIRLTAVLKALAVAIVAFLAGFPAWQNGLIGDAPFFLLLGLTPPMLIAGGLLSARSRVGGVRILAHRMRGAGKSFLMGCWLFLPLGIMNTIDGLPEGDLGWVSQWWMPWTLPFYSGIAEEVFFRLFLIGMCYWLIRPVLDREPTVAVVSAILVSAIIFGIAHGRQLDTLLTTGFLYGLPMSAVFAKRNWEYAVGAHYIINMISWIAAYQQS